MDYGLTGTTYDWVRLMLTADIPTGANKVGVFLELNEATGNAWFDAIQLETGKTANRYNMLADADFNTGYEDWIYYISGIYTPFRDSAIQMNGSAKTNAYAYQTVLVNKADVCFNVYGTAEGNSVPILHGNRAFMLELTLRYEDGKTEQHTKQFNDAYTGEQTISFTVKPKRTGVIVEAVSLSLIYQNNENSVKFKRAMLNVDMAGTSYGYDSDGNLISAADNANRNQTYSYSNANELLESVDAKNERYTYTYADDNPHRLVAARSKQLGNGFVYQYDDYGNVLNMYSGYLYDDKNLDFTMPSIYSGKTYNSTHNYVTSEKDSRGKTITYTVNDANGLVSKITSPAPVGSMLQEVSTSYSYNEQNPYLLGSVSRGGISNYFGYDSINRLTSIYHNGFNYNFTYDKWGNPLKTMIQNRMLWENEYEAGNKNLIKTTYGNGDWWRFSYDQLNRLAGKTSENGQAAEYVYDNQDQLVRITDYLSGNTTEYSYDLLGRLIGSRTNGNNDMRAEYSYDKYNRWTGQTNYTSGGVHAYGAEYGQDNLITQSNQGRFSLRYEYDKLNRITREKYYVDGTDGYYIDYGYVNGTVGSTTELVSDITYRRRVGEPTTLNYTYDDAGNIFTLDENGERKATYHYDQFGQLTREDNAWANKSYQYFYDNGGNLIKWTEHPYSTGYTLPAATKTVNYAYEDSPENGDPAWKDLLTKYNGITIQYDAIGNPLNWGSITNMQWSNGRRLTSLQKQDNMITYTYDESGLRTKKQVGSNITLYDRDATGSLVHETRNNGTDHLYYYYDANGSIGSISYNGVRYALLKNLQGDVIALMDTNCNIVARYTYDAWGRILSITDGNGNINTSSTFIGYVNPIRYRGYYYDVETDWYYLNSRYYDPRVKRFINADGNVGNTGNFTGMNLFAYCLNNPIISSDANGQSANSYFWLEEAIIVSSYILNKSTAMLNPVRAFIGDIANLLLGVMGCELSSAMFDYALYGNGNRPTYGLYYLMYTKLKDSEELNNAIRTVIDNGPKNLFFATPDKGFAFSENDDLVYSFHAISFAVTRLSIWNGSGYKISIYDRYDFTQWLVIEKGLSLGNVANDFAHILADTGMLKEYEILFSYWWYG